MTEPPDPTPFDPAEDPTRDPSESDSAEDRSVTDFRMPPEGREELLAAARRAVSERYRIDDVAGTGGMGRVYNAFDTVLDRRVAIKLLHVAGRGEKVRAAVLAEARAMARLRHPMICHVHELVLDGNEPYLVMDWIDGVDLRTAWRAADQPQRLALLARIIDAVAVAHHADVVHGDLKPANILVDRDGQPIIVDFGLARSAPRPMPTSRAIWGGTPGYAAPEQFESEGRIEPTADVYALGVLLFELLTNRRPFEGESYESIVEAARQSDPPLPETFAPDAPWPLQRICLVALERDPSRRYADAHAMALDLERYLKGETVVARPSMLTTQYVSQVEEQIDHVESWHRQGMVTETEANRLTRELSSLLRPESHWILDTRRLTISQVTLYLGGWLVVLAIGLGMYASWETLEAWPVARAITGGVVMIGLGVAGWWLHARSQRRVALGYLVTACLLAPLSMWLLLRETGWLGTPMPPRDDGLFSDREWAEVFFLLDATDTGLLNRQVLVISMVWLVVTLVMRRMVASSAFTPLAVLAATLAALAAWASAGMLELSDEGLGALGLWIALIGAVGLLPLGLMLNRREEVRARELGQVRMRTRDSWALLSMATVLIIAGLTIAAWYAADVYTLGTRSLRIEDAERDATTTAIAFMINGLLLQALSQLLGRRRTTVRTRLSESLRWLSPSHVLAGLLTLQLDAGDAWWMAWLLALAAASLVMCYISVWQQWRPFLFTGLFYIALAYGRSFVEVNDRLEDPEHIDRARLILMAAMAATGAALMALAWKLPDWRLAARLRQWRSR